MNYDEINVDEVLTEIDTAIDQGDYRQATKQEAMKVRLAALAAIVRNLQDIVEKDYGLSCSSKSA